MHIHMCACVCLFMLINLFVYLCTRNNPFVTVDLAENLPSVIKSETN